MGRVFRLELGDGIDNGDAGGVAAFPALTLDMQCILVGLRSKISLTIYRDYIRFLPTLLTL